MLDELSLRLLAEMGIEIYEPRAAADPGRPPVTGLAEPPSLVSETSAPSKTQQGTVLVMGASEGARWSADLLAALKWLGVSARTSVSDDLDSLRKAAGVVVLGESHARKLSAGLTAFEQDRLHWVIGTEAKTLASSVEARRALWGEMKRISRLLGASSG